MKTYQDLEKLFKFQSDSINTKSRNGQRRSGNIFKFQSDSINTVHAIRRLDEAVSFKFQSDSINTSTHFTPVSSGITLNSNLILLIPVFKDTFKTTGYNTYFRRPQK